MKRTNNMIKVCIAAISLFSVAFLSSCNKDMQDKVAVQSGSVDDDALVNTPIALWTFDSTFKELKQNLIGTPHKNATFTSTPQAKLGTAAFLSPKNGYVSYNTAGNKLPNLTTGLSVDFWVFAYPKEGGAQCVWCMPQSVDQNGDPAFWPTQHVLLDAYNVKQGDSGLIKVMIKANKNVPYNEEWTTVGGIPNFYHRWTHVQYSYNGATSKFTLIVNGHKYVDKATLYTADPSDSTSGAQPLGNLVANPDPKGILFGTFQKVWKPTLFGPPEVWMLPFKGRIDAFKVYDKAIF